MAEYIEREALIQTIQKDQWIGAQGKDYALCDIAEQPTADVVEVRHGEWKLYWDDNYLSWSHKCSECGKFPLCKEETMHDEVLSNYCPNCGAKMDGKGEE